MEFVRRGLTRFFIYVWFVSALKGTSQSRSHGTELATQRRSEWGRGGREAALIQGNLACWYGLFKWITSGLKDKKQKLIQRWVKKKKKFGTQTIAAKVMGGCLQRWCQYCGVA